MDRIATPFGFSSTADEVLRGVDLQGKQAIVTGAASGIGVDTARALAKAGAAVTLAVRNVDAGKVVAQRIADTTDNREVFVRPLDLADQQSVAAFVASWEGRLHILVNNAGIMALPSLERTSDGWEMQFATNFLGHFALTVGLHDALASARGARIVSVSSSANMYSPVNFDDLHFDFLPYDPFVAYGQSKTACVLLAVEATRRWAQDGILANALNPGAISTNLQKHTGGLKTPIERRKTTAQGAATSVLLAASPILEGIGGRYFEDCNEAPVVRRRPTDFSGGVAPYALDAANAERLWSLALRLCGAAVDLRRARGVRFATSSRRLDRDRAPLPSRPNSISAKESTAHSMLTITTSNRPMTVINVFTVAAPQQARLVEILAQATESSIRNVPGFVGAALHRSLDGTKVTMYAQWATPEDYDRMRARPDASPILAEALSIARFDPGFYEVTHVFRPDASRPAV